MSNFPSVGPNSCCVGHLLRFWKLVLLQFENAASNKSVLQNHAKGRTETHPTAVYHITHPMNAVLYPRLLQRISVQPGRHWHVGMYLPTSTQSPLMHGSSSHRLTSATMRNWYMYTRCDENSAKLDISRTRKSKNLIRTKLEFVLTKIRLRHSAEFIKSV